jgi:hypothetical protein
MNAADSRAYCAAVDPTHHAEFVDAALGNPINRTLLERMPSLGLADLWLVAGCLFQTLWNLRDGRPPMSDIRDYDLFYFDDSDLSWEAEDRAIRHCAALFADLGVTVELRNQARVHLWYERRFGHPCPRLLSSRHGIGRFPVAGTCIGLRPAEPAHGAAAGPAAIELFAPFGLGDMFDGMLRPNPDSHAPVLFRRKAESYRRRWPWLTIAEAAPEWGSEPGPR